MVPDKLEIAEKYALQVDAEINLLQDGKKNKKNENW